MQDRPKLITLRRWLSSDLLYGVKHTNTVCFESAAKKWAGSRPSLRRSRMTGLRKLLGLLMLESKALDRIHVSTNHTVP